MLQTANILVTGGAGTLGRAIARRRKKEGWTGKLTVYSTDEHKHALMRREYPDIQFVCGDIRNSETLYHAMVGHDVVIHAAAVKVIPVSEVWSLDTIDVNVFGSQNVCAAALRANIAHVLGISTDKACHPCNAYGAAKYLMEKIFQEYARGGFNTQFHLVRYGNVLESSGSVVEAWHKAAVIGEPIKMTDPNMTRFWLSPAQAVQYVMEALENTASGQIYIPKMPALSIGKLAQYTVGVQAIEAIPMRPGEKMHEVLVTCEEAYYSIFNKGTTAFILSPTTSPRHSHREGVIDWMESGYYSSDGARELSRDELIQLLTDE